MAKVKKCVSFKNALINSEDIESGKFVIAEVDKDDTRFYYLPDILLEFANHPGVSITITCDDDIDAVQEDDIL